jgi:hypothetical protein
MNLTVTVEVPVLLKKLRANREKHLKAYETAKKGYLKLLRRELETKLKVLDRQPGTGIIKGVHKVNGVSEAHLDRIVNQKPVHFLSHYDQAIEMLEFTTDESVTLDSQQYEQYIQDNWNWKPSFTSSNVAYAAAAARR